MIIKLSFCLFLLLTLTTSIAAQEQKIKCNYSEGIVSGDTMHFENAEILKELKGIIRNPDFEFANAIFEIYKIPDETKKKISYEEYKKLTELENRLVVCETVENTGKFQVKNLSNGKYLVQFTSRDIASSVEIYIIEISKKKGKKKVLKINFSQAI